MNQPNLDEFDMHHPRMLLNEDVNTLNVEELVSLRRNLATQWHILQYYIVHMEEALRMSDEERAKHPDLRAINLREWQLYTAKARRMQDEVMRKMKKIETRLELRSPMRSWRFERWNRMVQPYAWAIDGVVAIVMILFVAWLAMILLGRGSVSHAAQVNAEYNLVTELAWRPFQAYCSVPSKTELPQPDVVWCDTYGLMSTMDPAKQTNTEGGETIDSLTVDRNAGEKTVGVVVPDPISPKRELEEPLNTGSNVPHDLFDFAKNWYRINTYTVGTGAVAGTVIAQLNLPEAVFDLLNPKAAGFLGFTGTINIKAVVTSTDYQQSRVRLSFIPQYTDLGVMASVRFDPVVSSVTGLSQIAGVEMDISCDSEMVLTIPFINCREYCEYTPSTDWGTIFLWVYSPLLVGSGSTDYTVTLYGNFSDLKLINPTLPWNILSLRRPKWKGQMRRMRMSKGKNISESEGELKASGPVSSMLNKVATVATAVSGIPLISSFAKPVSWAASVASKVAHAFGFSAPLNTEMPRRMIQSSLMTAASNCDKLDNSENLGACITNQVEPMQLAGTDHDEHSLGSICSRFGYLTNVNWPASSTSGAILWSMNLVPRDLKVTMTVDTKTVYQFLNAGFVAHRFRWYNGAFVFKFKFTKTLIHAGKLLLVFFPGKDKSEFTTSFDDTHYAHREFIDIEEGNEFSFTVPYTSHKPLLETTQSYGSVCLYVVNPLRYTDVVANSVNIIVEAAMDAQTLWALPDDCILAPFVPAAAPAKGKGVMSVSVGGGSLGQRPLVGLKGQSGEFKIRQSAAQVLIQNCAGSREYELVRMISNSEYLNVPTNGTVGEGEVPPCCRKLRGQSAVPQKPKECAIANLIPIGGSRLNSDRLPIAKYVTGEQILSVLQLLKRANRTRNNVTDIQIVMRPATIGSVSTDGAGVLTETNMVYDQYPAIASCYAFSRGSMRIKVWANTGFLQGFLEQRVENTAPLASSTTLTPEYLQPTAYSVIASPATLGVQLPNYGVYAKRLNRYATPTEDEPVDDFGFQVSLRLKGGSSANYVILREVGDDFQLGFWLGPPPMYMSADT